MFTILIVVALFVVLDMIALRWGADSRERMSSSEWERRLRQEELLAKHRA